MGLDEVPELGECPLLSRAGGDTCLLALGAGEDACVLLDLYVLPDLLSLLLDLVGRPRVKFLPLSLEPCLESLSLSLELCLDVF